MVSLHFNPVLVDKAERLVDLPLLDKAPLLDLEHGRTQDQSVVTVEPPTQWVLLELHLSEHFHLSSPPELAELVEQQAEHKVEEAEAEVVHLPLVMLPEQTVQPAEPVELHCWAEAMHPLRLLQLLVRVDQVEEAEVVVEDWPPQVLLAATARLVQMEVTDK